MNKNLPVYKLKITEDDIESGVFAISLVDSPAIEKDWFAFNANEEKKFEFKQVAPDKQVLAGYFMIPDKLIYRRDNGKEYLVTFDKETIELIAERFNKNLLQNQFNIQHSKNNKVQAFIKENWIVDSVDYDKSKSFGFDSILGAWFGLVKVEDTTIWNEFIKTGKLNGFSIEGLFEMQIEKMMKNQKSISTKCGKQIFFDVMLMVGQEVDLPNGEYELESDLIATIKDNTLISLTEPSTPVKNYFKNIYNKK